MDLQRFPRRHYTPGPTPLHPLRHLTHALGGASLHVKRDDLLGLTAGGNKTRKLEFLVGDALAQGADTLITCGAVQSNHARLTLAAAITEGLSCQLLLEERVPGAYSESGSGNNFLFRLLGAQRIEVVAGGTDLWAKMQEMATAVRAQGGTPYVIPGGGSNPVGATGYADCAREILAQLSAQGLRIDRIVCASGSSGTHAGLLAGLFAQGAGIPVVGISVRHGREKQEATVFDLAQRTAEHLGVAPPPREAVVCFDEYVGEGYSLPTDGMVEAVQMLSRKEAILLDPVYTGKAMAGLIDLTRKGYFKSDENVLFLHTGGSPALYAYEETLLAQ